MMPAAAVASVAIFRIRKLTDLLFMTRNKKMILKTLSILRGQCHELYFQSETGQTLNKVKLTIENCSFNNKRKILIFPLEKTGLLIISRTNE